MGDAIDSVGVAIDNDHIGDAARQGLEASGVGADGRGPKYRRWMFTINNPTEVAGENLFPTAEFLVYQHEKGAEGTEHYQGLACFNQQKRFSAMKKLHGTAHWEVMKKSLDVCIKYCTKEDTRVAGPWTYGDKPKDKGEAQAEQWEQIRDDLREKGFKTTIKEMAETKPGLVVRCRRGIYELWAAMQPQKRDFLTKSTVLYGDPGCGKSTYVRKQCGDDLYVIQRGRSGEIPWFDGYEGQTNVLFDDFYGQVPYAWLLRLLDAGDLRVEVKGSSLAFISKHVWFTSNNEPKDWYPNIEDKTALLDRLYQEHRGGGRVRHAILSAPDVRASKRQKVVPLYLGLGGVETDLVPTAAIFNLEEESEEDEVDPRVHGAPPSASEPGVVSGRGAYHPAFQPDLRRELAIARAARDDRQ